MIHNAFFSYYCAAMHKEVLDSRQKKFLHLVLHDINQKDDVHSEDSDQPWH